MLSGSRPLQELIPDLPRISSFDIDPVSLEDVEVLQVQYEISTAAIEHCLPPALHPTLPPLGIWTAWSVQDSPWGSFKLVQFRISCRSGARPRTFLAAAAIDNDNAQRELGRRWGLHARLSEICFNRRYESADFCVCFNDKCVLCADMKDPENLSPNDVQFFANMHGADTPRGLRLVQFDPQFEVTRAERYIPTIKQFDAEAWGIDSVQFTYPVISYGCNAVVHMSKLRFMCKPDVSAFEGSETI